MSARRFELVEGTSSKFWQISVEGAQHTVRFGRIGTAGQEKTKTFADAAAARNDADKLIAEKTAKGYEERSASDAAAVDDADGDDLPPPKPAPALSPSAPAVGARRFEFVEGNSSKFWEIAVSGSQHTVRFGRIGTAGQEKTKTFADAAAAQKDADKLIAEKTAKGYVEH